MTPRFILIGIALASIPWSLVAGEHRSLPLNGQTFTLPEGFVIETVAGPPLVDRPIVIDFDHAGRLYVAESSGSNEKVEIQLLKRPHRILRLEDSDGDGVFDSRTVFADQMMFPEGVLWHDGSLYVAAPPSIWKLIDADGDGIADRREEWHQGKTLTGCANDLHGPYLGRDGWIYWCKGAFARQTYHGVQGAAIASRAAHIFRKHPKGSVTEAVMSGGMDNPVDVVFSTTGERFFTTTFFQHPAAGNRDGLIHALYGGVYGKLHDVINDHPWTSPDVLPVLAHLGPAAPCGLTLTESNALGPDDQGNLFATLFNMRKITRHRLTPNGATFSQTSEDFLVSDQHDFHPTDVIEDADGSLLVVDTGGWYKLCCPSSQLVKADVLGAIYRVRRDGAPSRSNADPRGRSIAWERLGPAELVALIDDPRPAVRRQAMERVAQRPADCLAPLQAILRSTSESSRRQAVWALTRLDQADARSAIRRALDDVHETVRHAAAHSAGLWRDAHAERPLSRQLHGKSLAVARAAAEALGRIGSSRTVPDLLAATARTDVDISLEHSLRYALIEIGDAPSIRQGLSSESAATRRAALVALDQMRKEPRPTPHVASNVNLNVQEVLPHLSAGDEQTRRIAWWIAGQHPEWSEPLARSIRDRLDADRGALTDAELAARVESHIQAPAIQAMIADMAGDASPSSAPKRNWALSRMAKARLKSPPASWLAQLKRGLNSADEEWARASIGVLLEMDLGPAARDQFKTEIARRVDQPGSTIDARLESIAAMPGGWDSIDPPLFAVLTSQAPSDQPASRRALALKALARSRLSKEQSLELTRLLPRADAMDVSRFLSIFEKSRDESLGLALLSILKQHPSLASQAFELFKLDRFGPKVAAQAAELRDIVDAESALRRARLDELLASVAKGDVRRGQAVFNSQKGSCVSCHSIGYVGGTLGPDLTRIGQIRNERDLLESVLFPSASFVRGFEPTVVVTKDGRVLSGVVKDESDRELTIVLDAQRRIRLARDEVEEMKPGAVSIMPAGLDRQLSPQELVDLAVFLKACR